MRENNEFINHSIKSIEYRFRKAIQGSNDNFGDFKISNHSRTPNEIINHMFDLAIKTKTMITEGHFNCPVPENLKFELETERFLLELNELKREIEKKEISFEIGKKLLQGPIIDIATHIGQIAMLNGLNGNKITKEDYYSADIPSNSKHKN